MRRFAYLVLLSSLVFATLALLGIHNAEAKRYTYIGKYEQPDSVVIAIHGGVSKYSLWPSSWPWWQRKAAEEGGMQVAKHMFRTGGDWVMSHVFIPSGDTLIWDSKTRVKLTFAYPEVDSAEILTAVSSELLLTDSPPQREIYSNLAGKLVLTEAVTCYYRAMNGAWVVFIRFPEGSLKLDHEHSVELAKMPVPKECWIVQQE